jgi:acyl carrier protein
MTTATDIEAILPKLQQAYDLVKADKPRTLSVDDRLIDDLELDSLDLIDVVSVLEEHFPTEVIDAVIDRSPEITTVGDLIDCFAASSA